MAYHNINDGPLALHGLVCINDADNVQSLLQSGLANVNEKDVDWGYRTALHWAAMKGFTECANVLLEFGANGTARMAYGITPAHCAAETGKLAVLKLFHRTKVSITRSDDFGLKPIDKAKLYGQAQCVAFLEQ